MSIKAYLKQVGRGSKGASDLSRSDAADLFSQLLSGTASALELGAFCMAMRIKGESAEELSGFYEALTPYLPSLVLSRPVWLLPSYNGARKTTLLTPLLAKMLVDKGYSVLVHGAHEEAQRTSSEHVFAQMGWSIVEQLSDLARILEQQSMAYCPLSVLCPALSRILSVREVIGVRNTGHVLAKLLNPIQSESFQVTNYTHPVYPQVFDAFYKNFPTNVVMMRGHEGEPVASPRRLPELYLRYKDSDLVEMRVPQYFDDMSDSTESIVPTAMLTAQCYQRMLSQQEHMPNSLVAQVDALHRAYRPVNTLTASE